MLGGDSVPSFLKVSEHSNYLNQVDTRAIFPDAMLLLKILCSVIHMICCLNDNKTHRIFRNYCICDYDLDDLIFDNPNYTYTSIKLT